VSVAGAANVMKTVSRAPQPVGRPTAWRPAPSDLVWVIVLVAGAVVVWTFRVVGSGTTFSPMAAGDTFGYFLPAYAYEAKRVAAGAFPFWNPYQGGGVPFLATLQPGALYPARLLTLVTSPPRAMGVSAFAHVLFALLATWALGRRLGATAAAAAVAAIVFATAFALPSITAPTLLEPGVWLPMVALATVAILDGGSWAWVPVLGVALAMPVLAGGYQMTVYTVYGAGLFALGILLERWTRDAPLERRVVGRLAVAGVLALATAAPQLLTTLAWSADTVRQAKPLTTLQMMPLFTEDARWMRFVAFFFRLAPSSLGYLSIPVVALAIIGTVLVRPLGLVLGLGALLTAALAVSGPQSALFAVYKAIPGFAMFRFPLRLLQLTTLLVGVTAALGLSVLVRMPLLAAPRRRVCLEAIALGTVVWLLVWPFRNDFEMPWRDDSRLAQPSPAFFRGGVRPPAEDRVYVPGNRFELGLAMFVRQGTVQQVRVLQDYEPLSSRRLAAFLSAVAGLPPPGADSFSQFAGAVLQPHKIARPELLDLVAVRGIVAPKSSLPPGGVPGWTETARLNAELSVYRNERALPRAYVVGRARYVADEPAALAAILDPAFDPRGEAVLVGTPASDAERAAAAATMQQLARARITVDEPEHVVVELDSTPTGVLVLADAFAPGWEATVDGERRPIWQANHLVRAVPIRPGDRRVEFRYRAPGFTLGMALLTTTWAATLVGLAVARRLRRGRALPGVEQG
jgi:hypothetical protein